MSRRTSSTSSSSSRRLTFSSANHQRPTVSAHSHASYGAAIGEAIAIGIVSTIVIWVLVCSCFGWCKTCCGTRRRRTSLSSGQQQQQQYGVAVAAPSVWRSLPEETPRPSLWETTLQPPLPPPPADIVLRVQLPGHPDNSTDESRSRRRDQEVAPPTYEKDPPPTSEEFPPPTYEEAARLGGDVLSTLV